MQLRLDFSYISESDYVSLCLHMISVGKEYSSYFKNSEKFHNSYFINQSSEAAK
jgi:hypothetical protein